MALALTPGWGQAQMLASIPVVSDLQHKMLPAASPLVGVRARIHAVDAAGLAKLLGRLEGEVGAAGYIDLTLAAATHPDIGSPADALAASFIVDFDDPAVVRLRRELVGEPGRATIGGEEIVAFVAKSMREDYAANAEFASQVARSLRGDCTEHALLTAALARSMQIPARIVNGAVLLYADGRWQAYGHAWVQTLEAGRWIVRDAAVASWPGPVYYVPAFVIADEGPGYRLGLMQGIGRMPARIEILNSRETQTAN